MLDPIASRYDAMVPSLQRDTVDNQPYPDILSLDFNTFEVNEPPFQYLADESLRRRPYQTISYFLENTARAQYDDIVLTLNNIPHKDLISEGTFVVIPVMGDIQSFLNKWKTKNGL